MALAMVLRETRRILAKSRWKRSLKVIGKLASSAWRCMYTSALSWKPRPRQIALAVSCAATALWGGEKMANWWYRLTRLPPVSIAWAAAVQSWSFLPTSGITSAILLLAFCVARTWLAVTVALVALGSSTCTPMVSRKGALYCKAGCIRSPIREPICQRAKRSGKDLME